MSSADVFRNFVIVVLGRVGYAVYVMPTTLPPKLVICPLNYTGRPHVSHTGLGISAMNTAKVLRNNGIDAVVRPVRNRCELESLLPKENPTHVVINALWMPTADLASLVHTYAHIDWAVLCHSNVAFLQVEPNGIRLLKDAVDLEQSSIGNFHVAANSRGGAKAIRDAWEAPAAYLPNLYYLDGSARPHRPRWQGGTMRIGAFGALRPLKNPTGSAFSAQAIATSFGTNLEFYINVGRNDGWGDRMLQSVRAVFSNTPNAKLVEIPWSQWSDFRRHVRHMHLLLQPSFTESFNIVTADGVSEGIPSVTSDVIEWVPRYWHAHPDDVNDISRVGRQLITDRNAALDGLHALIAHNEDGVKVWTKYLYSKPV